MPDTSRRGLFGWLAGLMVAPLLPKAAPKVVSVSIISPGMPYTGPSLAMAKIRLPMSYTVEKPVSFDWADFDKPHEGTKTT